MEASGEALRATILGAWKVYHRVREVFFFFISQGYSVSNGIAVGYDRLDLSLATALND